MIHQISLSDDLISSWESQPTSIVNDFSVFALSFHLGFLLDVAVVSHVWEVLRVLLDSKGLGIVSNLSGVLDVKKDHRKIAASYLCQFSLSLLEFSVVLHVWLELCVFGDSFQLRRLGYCCCLRFGDMSVKSSEDGKNWVNECAFIRQQLQHHSPPPPWVRRVDSKPQRRENKTAHTFYMHIAQFPFCGCLWCNWNHHRL